MVSAKHEVHLATNRLILRNVNDSDGDFLVKLWTDPDVTAFMGGPRQKSAMAEAFALKKGMTLEKEALRDNHLKVIYAVER